MNYKKLLWSVLAITVLWSCSKDDGPSTPLPAGAPTIANFTPPSGPVGTEITINGTNFSTTKTSNTVKIGTATATVTAATATQLKATVPTGATTGLVSVTVGGKTATSTTNFTVTVNGVDPTNEAPTAEDQNFEVSEDVAVGDVIGTVEANDGDEDELTFELVTDESELFQVAENGEITLAEGKNLDFETATEHSLTLSVSDGSNEPVEFKVVITVTNVIESLFDDPASFILKFNVSAGQTLTIGTNDSYNYDYSINWGDDSEDENLTEGFPSHEYLAEGEYLVAIKGTFPAIQMYHVQNNLLPDDGLQESRDALVDVVQWGTGEWQTMTAAFTGCPNLEGFSANDVPNLSKVTSMKSMFVGAEKFNGKIGNWNTSNVTNMAEMFMFAPAFNQDISDWTVSNVTDMSFMFQGATAFNQDISGWVVNDVTNMSFMFKQATAFNQDISGWTVTSVTNMSNMFDGATAFNQDIGGWDVSSVTDMSNMLRDAAAFDQNLGAWEFVSEPNLTGLFNGDNGMSIESMNATILGWANYVSTNGGPGGLTVGMGTRTICGPEVVEALGVLANNNWNFTGGDLQLECN
ncbi:MULTISPECIES: BspA family leucine-rich repeat surface protein [unclassified Allomuricauda]|uniref:BspA family leucine-rich repeat surface protein n=1 Tax=unclassified Allomuricauda TaxID=2615049 RepID=UPI00273E0E00|nr:MULTISPECIES: BspA family leucine-rich repeat surface protein [unclassified Allomuricauda]